MLVKQSCKVPYPGRKKCGTLHDFACHPCAGAMLIFSVSFQFYYMCSRSWHEGWRFKTGVAFTDANVEGELYRMRTVILKPLLNGVRRKTLCSPYISKKRRNMKMMSLSIENILCIELYIYLPWLFISKYVYSIPDY